MENIVAIITARGGSKRIPKKNIKDFFGKPMLNYAINACKESDIFSEIMVSTDSDEIADIARQCGAEVPFMRSQKTASDYATTFEVLEEVVTLYKERGKEFLNVCCVYPCVPFLTGDILKDAYQQLKSFNTASLMPVCQYPVPIEWAMDIEEDILIPHDQNAQLIRSQDLKPKYFDVGMFYFARTVAMLEERRIAPHPTKAYIIEEHRIQDIDTAEDWNMAEMKYKLYKEQQNG
jgi:N-acylneuraminate cytidylyltransferase